MSEAGRLARGKANYSKGVFLDNPETIEYINSIKEEVIVEPKKEKKKNGR